TTRPPHSPSCAPSTCAAARRHSTPTPAGAPDAQLPGAPSPPTPAAAPTATATKTAPCVHETPSTQAPAPNNQTPAAAPAAPPKSAAQPHDASSSPSLLHLAKPCPIAAPDARRDCETKWFSPRRLFPQSQATAQDPLRAKHPSR